MRVLVTGGAGFIGSNYVRSLMAGTYPAYAGSEVVVLDLLTYAGTRTNLAGCDPTFVHGDIRDRHVVTEVMAGTDVVVHFAAESHVDRSITGAADFVSTNVVGTQVLLQAALDAGVGRFVHVSTDEVYGSIAEGSFVESSALEPSSPYSATKAGADLLVASYHRTYGVEAVICRGSNNYGPYQYPEKLIPLMVCNALGGDLLPVYGDGLNVRNWLYVEDFDRAIGEVLAHGRAGEAYNVGGPDECTNLEVVRRILTLCGRDESLIDHVPDRPGHDRRYSLSSEKVRALGWEAQIGFAEGLERTVAWYRDNRWWWEPIRSGAYRDYYLRQYGRALG